MAVSAPQIRRLEELGADAWPAETTEWRHGWRLGFTGGVTRRANSVLPNRRGGVARAIVAALAGWAGRQGAPSMYLQVEADNRPAQRLYRAWGFRPAYRYHYLAV